MALVYMPVRIHHICGVDELNDMRGHACLTTNLLVTVWRNAGTHPPPHANVNVCHLIEITLSMSALFAMTENLLASTNWCKPTCVFQC